MHVCVHSETKNLMCNLISWHDMYDFMSNEHAF
jgi:hypothetical protein